MEALIGKLWLVAVIGLGVTGIALQRRFASLRALIQQHHPALARQIGASAGDLPDIPALLGWLMSGGWMRVEDPLLKAYGATCLRLLRLSLAWLVALLAATLVAR